MSCVNSFPPLASPQARLLILGSMPGVASLRAQRYYAHPQNLFWKILGGVLGFDAADTYEERTQHLVQADIAVWDVLQSCVREGSLDSDIDRTSVITNDFNAFFAAHPLIKCVCFNGSAAESIYMLHVKPVLPINLTLEYVRLPSTSPANASIPLAEKQESWSSAISAGTGTAGTKSRSR